MIGLPLFKTIVDDDRYPGGFIWLYTLIKVNLASLNNLVRIPNSSWTLYIFTLINIGSLEADSETV